MAAITKFDPVVLERICDVLADTGTGLTGSEIGKLLRRLSIDDPMPAMTKRLRLFDALSRRQQTDHSGNLVAAFIHEAMNPVRHTGSADYFERKRGELNEVLAFAGYELGEDGNPIISSNRLPLERSPGNCRLREVALHINTRPAIVAAACVGVTP
jgi:hypothetical protein